MESFLKMNPVRISGCPVSLALIALVAVCSVQANLRCYDCKYDTKKTGNAHVGCVYDVNSTYTPRECQTHEKYCKIERSRLNRIVRTFERDCADTCVDFLQTRGFGVDEETWVSCCSTDGCNHSSSAPRIDWDFGLLVSILVLAYRV